MIEVEIRSFLSEEQYKELLEFFTEQCGESVEEHQETHYFDAPVDIRIQRNDSGSKIWLKKGKLHDDAREEIEVKCKREEFENLEQIFAALGYKVKIKWFRTRHTFLWNEITVTVDFTKGYGHILELEMLTDEEGKDAALQKLHQHMEKLGVAITPKEEFNKKFEYYEQHWRELV